MIKARHRGAHAGAAFTSGVKYEEYDEIE